MVGTRCRASVPSPLPPPSSTIRAAEISPRAKTGKGQGRAATRPYQIAVGTRCRASVTSPEPPPDSSRPPTKFPICGRPESAGNLRGSRPRPPFGVPASAGRARRPARRIKCRAPVIRRARRLKAELQTSAPRAPPADLVHHPCRRNSPAPKTEKGQGRAATRPYQIAVGTRCRASETSPPRTDRKASSTVAGNKLPSLNQSRRDARK